ncbi:MAG TPA: hypothetical protein VGD67_23420 [Pseudonocardiaceae bacterium]
MTGTSAARESVLLTHVAADQDFEVGPEAPEADLELAERLYRHGLGSAVIECREHDDEPAARDSHGATRRPGIRVRLVRPGEGTPAAHWRVVHHDDRYADHQLLAHPPSPPRREWDAWAEAAHAAGYPAEAGARHTGVRCDLLIRGPRARVDVEVQRTHIRRACAVRRAGAARGAGLLPLWSTDCLTTWAATNAVPHIRTNDLPEGHAPRDQWLVVGGLREVLAVRCVPGAFPVCPATGRGVTCGRHHPALQPPATGVRVYQVAELVPAGGLVPLDAGRPGTVLVTPEHHDLWHELTDSVGTPRTRRCAKCGTAPTGPGGVLCTACFTRLRNAPR